MTAIIQRDFDFQAGVYFQNTFLMNLYSFTLVMEVTTDSIHEQNVAMDRLKYFVYEVLENSVFVQDSETEMAKKYQDAGLKVCTLPDEPYDQILALILMLKFNSMCEGRLKVVEVTFTSKLSDEVRFKESVDTAEHTFDNNGWWADVSPNLCNNEKKGRGKVVKLKNNEWNEVGFTWKEKKDTSKEIVFNIAPEK